MVTKTSRRKSVSFVALTALLLSVMVPMGAAASGPGGNVSEEDLAAYDWCDKFEWEDGAYEFESGPGYVTIDADSDRESGEWTSTQPVSIIFVKGGPDNDGGTILDPPATSGTFSNSGLPTVGSGNIPDISNITFCGDDVSPATATATIEKEWDEDLVDDENLPVDAVAFTVTVTGFEGYNEERTVGIDEPADFDELVVGEEYTVEWAEDFSEEIESFVNEDGQTCTLDRGEGGSVVGGSDTFTAAEGENDLGTFTAVNVYTCVDDEVPASATATIEKEWDEDLVDDENLPVDAVAFTVMVTGYDGYDEERTVGIDDPADFDELVVGEEYTVEWAEDFTEDIESFVNEAGQTCTLEGEDEGSVFGGSDTFTAEEGLNELGPFTAINVYTCVDDEVPASATASIEKLWDEDLVDDENLPVDAVAFTVTVTGEDYNEVRTDVGIEEAADFSDLVVGEEYTVAWEEQYDEEIAIFVNEAGQICFIDDEDEGSVFEGSETFTAVEGVNELGPFTAVNLYTCVDEEVLASVDVEVEKSWVVVDEDGNEQSIDDPTAVGVEFDVALLDADGELLFDEDGDPLVVTLTEDEFVTFAPLEDGVPYQIAFSEFGAPESFTDADGAVCTFIAAEEDGSATVDAGVIDFIAGEVDVIEIEAVNAYECESGTPEPQEEPEVEVLGVQLERAATTPRMPDTGASALLLTLLGLLGIGMGSGILARRRLE